MEQDRIKRLEGLESVREWMRAFSPTEWQTDRIDGTLTFTWLMDHLGEPDKWNPRFDIDTAPREAILTEAVRRLLVRISKSGYCRWAVEAELRKMADWQ